MLDGHTLFFDDEVSNRALLLNDRRIFSFYDNSEQIPFHDLYMFVYVLLTVGKECERRTMMKSQKMHQDLTRVGALCAIPTGQQSYGIGVGMISRYHECAST